MQTLEELLHEYHSCQLCGSRLKWDQVDKHQRLECKNKTFSPEPQSGQPTRNPEAKLWNPFLKTEPFVKSAFTTQIKPQCSAPAAPHWINGNKSPFYPNVPFNACYLSSLQNKGDCKYCGIQLKGVLEMSASLMVIYHEQRCRSNPANQCEFCRYVQRRHLVAISQSAIHLSDESISLCNCPTTRSSSHDMRNESEKFGYCKKP